MSLTGTGDAGATAVQRSVAAQAAWIVVAIIILSFFMPWHAGDNTDVSWLIVICEKLLDGERLYVDILETNPPFSVALYYGPVWLARHFDMSPELLIDCLVYLAFLIGFGLSAFVIEKGRIFGDLDRRWIYPALAVLLLIMPGNSFGQREHFGMMLFMPMLFLMMWRADTHNPQRVTLLLAVFVGLAASVLLLVKPHWALGIALPYLLICWRRRSLLACMTVENVVIGVVCTAYLASVWLWFPAFFGTFLPLLMRYYVGLRANINILVALPTFVVFVVFIALQMRKSKWRTEVSIALASALGFFVSMVYLGKYWNNHQYPYQVALLSALLLAVGYRWRRVAAKDANAARERKDVRLHSAVALAAVAALSIAHQHYQNPERRLIDAITSRYDNPSVVQISSDLSVGNPLTRRVNGRWLSAYAHDWVGAHALWGIMQGDYSGEDERIARRDLDDYTRYEIGLIRDQKPDIILIDRMDKELFWSLIKLDPPLWVVWMRHNAEFQSLMSNYEKIALGDYIEVYSRRQSAETTAVSPPPSLAEASD